MGLSRAYTRESHAEFGLPAIRPPISPFSGWVVRAQRQEWGAVRWGRQEFLPYLGEGYSHAKDQCYCSVCNVAIAPGYVKVLDSLDRVTELGHTDIGELIELARQQRALNFQLPVPLEHLEHLEHLDFLPDFNSLLLEIPIKKISNLYHLCERPPHQTR